LPEDQEQADDDQHDDAYTDETPDRRSLDGGPDVDRVGGGLAGTGAVGAEGDDIVAGDGGVGRMDGGDDSRRRWGGRLVRPSGAKVTVQPCGGDEVIVTALSGAVRCSSQPG
jgi:hypothetical protein